MLEDIEELLRASTVLHPDSCHPHGEDQPKGRDEEMTRAPLALFARVVAAAPPWSVVLTACLSRIPALGWRRWPAATRTSPRSRSGSRCQVPSFRQRQKY
jgi:hypothetical protein